MNTLFPYTTVFRSPRAVMRAPIRGKATMSDLQARFEQAQQDVQGLSERPDNDTLLRRYALYKQGSEGDVSGPKPGFFDFVPTAKYDACAKLAGSGQADSKQKYVALMQTSAG